MDQVQQLIEGNRYPAGAALAGYRLAQWLRSPQPYLAVVGYALLLGFWYLSVEVLKLPRFAEMPGLTQVVHEWLSPNPTYGVSIYTPVYYQHILVSLQRIAIAFTLATILGVPFGLLLGWSQTELATKAGLMLITIQVLESKESLTALNTSKVYATLEAAGVEFVDGEPGVKLKAKPQSIVGEDLNARDHE